MKLESRLATFLLLFLLVSLGSFQLLPLTHSVALATTCIYPFSTATCYQVGGVNSTLCPSYGGTWDSGTSTCTIPSSVTWEISGGGTFDVPSGTGISNYGNINVYYLTLDNSGTITNENGGVISAFEGTYTNNFGTIYNYGTIGIGGSFNDPASFSNYGTIYNYGFIYNSYSFNNALDENGGIYNYVGGTITNVGDFAGNPSMYTCGGIFNQGPGYFDITACPSSLIPVPGTLQSSSEQGNTWLPFTNTFSLSNLPVLHFSIIMLHGSHCQSNTQSSVE